VKKKKKKKKSTAAPSTTINIISSYLLHDFQSFDCNEILFQMYKTKYKSLPTLIIFVNGNIKICQIESFFVGILISIESIKYCSLDAKERKKITRDEFLYLPARDSI
jgi:hypothetical protein